MKKILSILLLVLAGITLVGCMEIQGQETEYTDEMLDSFIDFNLKTLDVIDTDDNFLFSPLSLYYALAILYSFSSDTAESDLNELFGITKDDMLTQIEALADNLPTSDEYTDFNMGNFVYYDNSYNNYLINGLGQYESVFPYELDELDFPSGDAGKQLVEKIDEITDGFLKLPESAFDYLKLMTFLINNTVYYRGTWKIEFNESVTEEKTFHSLGGIEQMVDMMTKIDNYSNYYESEKSTAVQNFFKDGSSMIFVLPDESISITELINDHVEMRKLLQPESNFELSTVRISIPKFTYINTILLKNPLQNLGLNSIWSPSRDNFSLITDSDFFIQDISQIAKIQIDEIGVKVAATTTIYATSSGPFEIIDFTLDRPFFYIILSPDEIPMFFGASVSF